MKNKFFRLFLTISFALTAHEIFGQNKGFFEGILYNSFALSDSTGNKKSFPWEGLIEYYDRNHILLRLSETNVSGHFEIYLDGEARAIYEIDHNQQKIKKLTSRKVERIAALEFEKIGEAKLLGYNCDIYRIKYVNGMETLENMIPVESLTMTCTYFIAKNLKIQNAEVFANLQNNKNSKLLDGRFDGVALKVIREFSNGDKLIIETTKVEEKDVQDAIKLPAYTFQE